MAEYVKIKIKIKRKKSLNTTLSEALSTGDLTSINGFSLEAGEPIDFELSGNADKYLILGNGQVNGSAQTSIGDTDKVFLKARSKNLVDNGLFIRSKDGNLITLRDDSSNSPKILSPASGGTGSDSLSEAINSVINYITTGGYKTNIDLSTIGTPTLSNNVYLYNGIDTIINDATTSYEKTNNTKIDIQPDETVLNALSNDGISAMWIENTGNSSNRFILKCLDSPISSSIANLQITLCEVKLS